MTWHGKRQSTLNSGEQELDQPFEAILCVLDSLYRNDEDVELPTRSKHLSKHFPGCRTRKCRRVCRSTCHCIEEIGEVRLDIPDWWAAWHMLYVEHGTGEEGTAEDLRTPSHQGRATQGAADEIASKCITDVFTQGCVMQHMSLL